MPEEIVAKNVQKYIIRLKIVGTGCIFGTLAVWGIEFVAVQRDHDYIVLNKA